MASLITVSNTDMIGFGKTASGQVNIYTLTADTASGYARLLSLIPGNGKMVNHYICGDYDDMKIETLKGLGFTFEIKNNAMFCSAYL
jgi:coproporphyrinogen III oxidase-like Fe-S oxidoreductase